MVLTGHLHRPFAEPLPVGDRQTWSIGSGTLSHRQRGAPASFTTLTLNPGRAEAVIWDIADDVARPRAPLTLVLRH
jgi:hypothetical protein